MWKSGQTLGPYTVKSVKFGGMGVVLHVSTRDVDDDFVLKTCKPQYLAHSHLRRAFQEEAKLWIYLSRHPNVVKAIAVEEYDEQLFVKAELIKPGRLGNVSAEDLLLMRRMWTEESIVLGVHVCRAMNWANQELPGFVHRDIKPGNILLDGSTAKLGDFGLSAFKARLTAHGSNERTTLDTTLWSGAAVGTIDYMAPEVVSRERASVSSDIYSLGATLFHLVTGRPVFIGSDQNIRHGHLVQAPLRPSQVTPTVPRQLDELILRCLAKRPDKRWKTFRDLGKALQRTYLRLTGTHVPKVGGLTYTHLASHQVGLERLGGDIVADMLLEKARSSTTGDDIVHVARELSKVGRNDEAIAAFRKAIDSTKITASYPDLEAELCACLFNARRFAELHDFTTATVERGGDVTAHVRAFYGTALLLSLRQREEAKKQFSLAVREVPEDSTLLTNIGCAWREFGDTARAARYFEEALNHVPHQEGALYNLAMIYRAECRYSETAVLLRKFLQVSPTGKFAKQARRVLADLR